MGLMDGDIGDRKPFHETREDFRRAQEAAARAAEFEAWKREHPVRSFLTAVIALPIGLALATACWVVPVLALYLLWLFLGGCAEPWDWKATGLCS